MTSRESRHLWVGGLPEGISESGIRDYFSKFGKIEGVKILPQKYRNIGVAAFIDFYDVRSASQAHEAKHKLEGCDVRTNYKSKPTERFDRESSRRDNRWSEGPGAEKEEKATGASSSSSANGSDSSASSDSSDGSEEEKEGKKVNVDTVFLKVTGLGTRPERVIQDGLYYEMTQFSPSATIKLYGDGEKLHAVVKFKKVQECRDAYNKLNGVMQFGTKLKLTPLDIEEFPPKGRDAVDGPNSFFPEEMDPQATRSLFVGNIPKNISVYELRDIFSRFGNILDVEIKKMTGTATYGFVLYYDLMSAVNAKRCMDGESVHGNKIRVGFGKGTPSKTLWLDGIDPTMSESQLERQMTKFGEVVKIGIDRVRCCAMVQYDSMETAKEALNSVKGTYIGSSTIPCMVDFANRDARAAFFSRTEGFDGPPPAGTFPMQPMYNPMLDPHRRAMMMAPRPGIPIMPMSRGGFPPGGHGPPDLYYPYMDDAAMGYYGGRPPFGGIPVGPFRQFPHPYDEAFEDYEEELRAFTRKRKRERELEKKKDKRKGDDSSKSSDSESDSSSSKKKKKVKEKGKKQSSGDKSKPKDESSESEDEKEAQRLRATQKSRELRERRKSKKKAKSDGEASSEEEVEGEGTSKKASRKKSSESKRGKDVDENLSKPVEEEQKKADEDKDKIENTKPIQSPVDGDCSLVKESKTEVDNAVAERKVEENTIAAEEEILPTTNAVDPMEHSPVATGNEDERANRNDEDERANRKVESDLSSGEDFKDEDDRRKAKDHEECKSPEQAKVLVEKKSPVVPDSEPNIAEEKQAKEEAPSKLKRSKHKAVSGEDSDAKTSDNELKKMKHLPLRYQLNEDNEEKSRSKDHHKQSAPQSTSPPPPSQRHKQPRRSPSPPDYRWQRNARPHSPGPQHRYRQYSRSPLGGGSTMSPRRPQSPSYGASPPRNRSPVHRSREYTLQRHRYDSPSHGKGGSGHSPHHRHYSPSPSRAHSPSARHHVRHRSRSSSLSRRSPVHHRKEATPSEVSPSVRELKKQSKHVAGSRSPSPRGKHPRDATPKEEPKEPLPALSKKPQAEEGRPKSPASSPPPPLPLPVQKDEGRRLSAGRVAGLGSSGGQSVVPLVPEAQSVLSLPPLPPPLPQQQQQQPQSQQQSVGKKPPLPSAKPPACNLQPPVPVTPTSVVPITTTIANPPLPQQLSLPQQQQTDNLMNLLRRYPVMWQGHLALKNDAAAVQLHFLSGNGNLAKVSLPQVVDQRTPALRIVQRMRLEPSQLEGVERRIQNEGDHCLLLALPCGRDAADVRNQTHILKTSLISYLLQKQAAGIINVQSSQQLQGSQQSGYVLHIFPPCPFSESHLARVAPDLLSSASDNCHLMIVVATL